MRFVCLVYAAPEFFAGLSPDEEKTFQNDCAAYDKNLERGGYFRMATPLQPAQTAVTVRVRDKRISITDGPFAETKEHLCGFLLIEAADRDEAVRLASTDPFALIGSVEVRPVMEIGQQ